MPKEGARGKEKAKPMPSLIFNEGLLNDEAEEKEREIKIPDEPAPHFSNPYNPKATKLMWFGVITMTFLIFFFWTWSLVYQFSSLKWSKTPEVSFYEATKRSWRSSFQPDNKPTADFKKDIKASLEKLFAGSISTSTTAGIPTSSATSS